MNNNNFIPLSVPNFTGNEKKYVDEAIKSEWVSTAGKYITEFEENISEYVKSKGGVACQSGTAGIHIALLICDISNKNEVIVPALTFIATVNPVKYVGADPIFIDCDDSLTIDVKKIREFCETECEFIDGKLINKNSRKHVGAIIPVHIFGNMCDMDEIMEIANRFNLKVIEDATEALGTYYIDGKYKGKYAGTIGDIGIYSFNGNKIITTGGGGMIVSNNMDTIKKAKYLTTQAKNDELYYIHNEIGYNYRMTNLQAALGIAQLEQLEDFIKIKEDNYTYYQEELSLINGLKLLSFKPEIRANYWFYSVLCNKDEYGYDKDEIIRLLSGENIQSRPIWGLNCDQKPYRNCYAYKIEKARYYINNVVNIPCSTNLSISQRKFVVGCLKKYGKEE